MPANAGSPSGKCSPTSPSPARAEQRVGEGVAHGVAVGVTREAGLALEPDAAEPQLPPVVAGVHVESQPHAGRGHQPPSTRACARSRSAGVVILKLRGSPSTATTR